MALPIFAITLFVSAFLLFLVQPMIGKLILPKLGGTPQVWNTCMVFFQSVLLLGYAYTHWASTKLKLRQQLLVHCCLLVVPILVIFSPLVYLADSTGFSPFYSSVKAWVPPAGSNPIPQTLLLLGIVVGIPFFVVSTSAPLLQRWFAYSGDPSAKDPYFLYGASNLGSLLSLLFYPAFIEPWAELKMQSNIWVVGYLALAGCIGYCAYMIFKLAPPDSVLDAQAALAATTAEAEPKPEATAPVPAPAPVPAAEASTAVKPGPGPGGGRSIQRKKGKHLPPAAAGKPEEVKSIAKPTHAPPVATGATAPMTPWRRLRWVLLAAVPSSLMLGVTSYISTDLSPFPLVWVVPLALYLLSFILVYMKVWTGRTYQVFAGSHYTLHDMVVYIVQPLGIIVLCFIILSHRFDPFWVTFAVMFGFFASALACHGELAHDRPAPKHLTEYFLLMSVGGMIGGLFNGIIAPIVFQRGVFEFHIAVIIAAMIRPQYMPSGWFDDLILNAFPGLQNWARNQGNEMAKSMGRPAPNTTYMFSFLLDIIFGIFILSISYWLATTFIHHQTETTFAVAKFLQLPLGDEYARDKWTKIVFNVSVYFIPLVFCFFFAGRPLRFSLAVAGLMLGNLYFASSEDPRTVLESRRTYFGILRVRLASGLERADFVRDPEEREQFSKIPLRSKEGEILAPPYPYTYLMHGTTYHGRNYLRHYDGDEYQKHRIDLSRLATTYYHRYGPVGIVMEQYNWSLGGIATAAPRGAAGQKDANPGAQNDFTGDLRMPASIIGHLASAGNQGFPLSFLANTYSEPPIATIGLGTGTMASYARPLGSMTYYEIDDVIRQFNLPEELEGANRVKDARFTFLQNAIRRGVNLEVIMGDARQSLEPALEPKNDSNSWTFQGDFTKPKLGGDYPHADAMYNYEPEKRLPNKAPGRNNYYNVINVDAFSSDAIPVHLVTKEAIEIYMSKLTEDGVLCVHTSNRHMDLVRPVARIALELKLNCRVGKDSDKGRYMGHFSSEYVMIYKGDGFTKHLKKLADKKAEFVANREKAVKGGQETLLKMKAEGVQMMRAEGGDAPPGWQILNSQVYWYDPFEEHKEYKGGRIVNNPITVRDSLWTDDYTYILGLLR